VGPAEENRVLSLFVTLLGKLQLLSPFSFPNGTCPAGVHRLSFVLLAGYGLGDQDPIPGTGRHISHRNSVWHPRNFLSNGTNGKADGEWICSLTFV